MSSLAPRERDRSDSAGRVHFVETQITPDHTGQIVVTLSPDQTHADAHLGFLQKDHRYGIAVTIPRYLGDNIGLKTKNPHLALISSKTDKEKTKHVLSLELLAHQEGLMNEELHLRLPETRTPFVCTVSARVLGKGKGTPMLKTGIHLLAVEHSTDSDTSETSDTKNGV